MPLSRRLSGLLVFSLAAVCFSCAAIRPVPPEYEKSLMVTAAAYNSLPGQTDARPRVGAWGDTIAPGLKAIAISPDLGSLGLRRGTKVRIEGLPGEYVVLDMMPAQWKRHIDIYMGEDVKAARSWGRRKVKIWWTNAERSAPVSRWFSPLAGLSRSSEALTPRISVSSASSPRLRQHTVAPRIAGAQPLPRARRAG
jgi:3D (Asp-Asp-Asp) domain-containing protein